MYSCFFAFISLILFVEPYLWLLFLCYRFVLMMACLSAEIYWQCVQFKVYEAVVPRLRLLVWKKLIFLHSLNIFFQDVKYWIWRFLTIFRILRSFRKINSEIFNVWWIGNEEKKTIKLNTVTLLGCQKFNFTSGSLVHFGHLNIPRDVKMAKMDSGTRGKVKFPWHPCKVTVNSYFLIFSCKII